MSGEDSEPAQGISSAGAQIQQQSPVAVVTSAPSGVADDYSNGSPSIPAMVQPTSVPVVAGPDGGSSQPEAASALVEAGPVVSANSSNPLSVAVGPLKVKSSNGYSSAVVGSAQQAGMSSQLALVPLNNHLQSESATASVSAAEVSSSSSGMTGHLANQARPDGTVAQATLVEAFDWQTPVQDGIVKEMTVESGSSGTVSKGWQEVEAPDHWATLTRESNQSIPVLSDNAAQILGALSGTSVEHEAGVVFGKLAAGWSVRISGRAEKPVFFDSQDQSITADDLEGERYFAFVNVDPGAHLVYLTNSIGADAAGVGIPVLQGTSTFVDLSSPSHGTVKGRVLDGGDGGADALPDVRVRVLGKADAEVVTDSEGRFSIPDVITLGDHPVFMESDAEDGFTHRYQIQPSQLGGVTLYRLDQDAINTFLSQLEGSVSPDSGLILAAVPGLVASQEGNSVLMPDIKSLAGNPTLHPELYTISSNGQLEIGHPLDANSTRLISVQVPEGPALVSAKAGEGRKVVWSELIMSSPGVVSLVGPY